LEQHDLETPLCYSRPYCAIADAPSQVSDQWSVISY
jgi:cobalt/nickel transport system ATP-binding protein